MAVARVYILVIAILASCGATTGLADAGYHGNTALRRVHDQLMESLGLDPPGAGDGGGIVTHAVTPTLTHPVTPEMMSRYGNYGAGTMNVHGPRSGLGLGLQGLSGIVPQTVILDHGHAVFTIHDPHIVTSDGVVLTSSNDGMVVTPVNNVMYPQQHQLMMHQKQQMHRHQQQQQQQLLHRGDVGLRNRPTPVTRKPQSTASNQNLQKLFAQIMQQQQLQKRQQQQRIQQQQRLQQLQQQQQQQRQHYQRRPQVQQQERMRQQPQLLQRQQQPRQQNQLQHHHQQQQQQLLRGVDSGTIRAIVREELRQHRRLYGNDITASSIRHILAAIARENKPHGSRSLSELLTLSRLPGSQLRFQRNPNGSVTVNVNIPSVQHLREAVLAAVKLQQARQGASTRSSTPLTAATPSAGATDSTSNADTIDSTLSPQQRPQLLQEQQQQQKEPLSPPSSPTSTASPPAKSVEEKPKEVPPPDNPLNEVNRPLYQLDLALPIRLPAKQIPIQFNKPGQSPPPVP